MNRQFVKICAVQLCILFAAAVFIAFWPKEIQSLALTEVPTGCHISLGRKVICLNNESTWRIVNTTLFLTFLMEFAAENLSAWLYPPLATATKFWDHVGYVFIISSLLFSSYLPPMVWWETDVVLEVLVCVGQAVGIWGVMHKLRSLGKGIVEDTFTSDILWTLMSAQLLMTVAAIKAEELNGIRSYVNIAVGGLKLYAAMRVMTILPRILNIPTSEKNRNATECIALAQKFTCVTLCAGLAAFLSLTGTIDIYLASIPLQQVLVWHIKEQLVFIVMIVIVPGRALRGNMIALEERIDLLGEMDNTIQYISHEVRSPLSTTALGLNCLQETVTRCNNTLNSKAADLQELIEDCKFSCYVAISTLNDLLLYYKLGKNRLSLEKTSVCCKTFYEDILYRFKRQLALDKKQLRDEIDVNLLGVRATIDKHKLEQVMRNLISNADKFTPENTGLIVIRATYIPDHAMEQVVPANKLPSYELDGTLHVEVTDNGVGISQENIAKLFKQYEQIDPSRLQGGRGSGLGLWLIKTIIELHAGKVGVWSAGEGQGSTFFFDMPAAVKMHDETLTNPIIQPQSMNDNALLLPFVSANMMSKSHSTEEDKPLKSRSRDTPNTGTTGKMSFGNWLDSLDSISSDRVLDGTDVASLQKLCRVMSDDKADNRNPNALQIIPNDFTPTRMRVLIVDDSIVVRKLMEKLLSTVGAECAQASSGASALDYVKKYMVHRGEQEPRTVLEHETKALDVVLTDYYMPGELNGPETVKRMREEGFEGCIIACSATTSPHDRRYMLECGAQAIMLKPFDLQRFLDTVYNAFGAQCSVDFGPPSRDDCSGTQDTTATKSEE